MIDEKVVRPLQRLRLVDQVTERLRDMIFNGELQPGHQLLQVQLSELLGVSRTPLREAFRILERDGLLRVSNGNQTVEVIELTPSEILELYQVREVMDGLSARLLTKAGVTADVEHRLTESIARMEKALSPRSLDVTGYGAAHLDFHLGIMLANPNKRLHEMQHIVRISSQLFLVRYLHRTGKTNTAADLDYLRGLFEAGTDDHKSIFESIVGGDGTKAETLAKRHIRKTMREISQVTHSAL
jgi:DNA-binding GntR family transcriptional regulator